MRITVVTCLGVSCTLGQFNYVISSHLFFYHTLPVTISLTNRNLAPLVLVLCYAKSSD